jgi:UDP-N-acetylmuramoyl-tripeptide--D-alanyl-D-alanine ligase
VAVTGSSGKTTTRELLTAILSQKYKVVSTQGNFNSETGLPLSMFSIKEEHELGIFEMGMNRKNEIFEIAKVFKPQYAVITNIGIAHVGLLGSRQNIAQEKKHIFDFFTDKSIAVLPAEDDFRSFLEEGAFSMTALKQKFTAILTRSITRNDTPKE